MKKNESLKTKTLYKTESNPTIQQNSNVKDLEVIMWEDLTLKEHNNKVAGTTAREMVEEITRPSRQGMPCQWHGIPCHALAWHGMALFKTLVLSRM